MQVGLFVYRDGKGDGGGIEVEGVTQTCTVMVSHTHPIHSPAALQPLINARARREDGVEGWGVQQVPI